MILHWLTGQDQCIKYTSLTFASNVLPHPGGPANSIPGGLVNPKALNASGLRTGASIAMVRSSLIPSKAPTSSHVTSGIVANPSLLADGCTSGNACWKHINWMCSV